MSETKISVAAIKKLCSTLKGAYPRRVSLETWCGLPVLTDASLPENVIEVRDKDGRAIKRVEWKP